MSNMIYFIYLINYIHTPPLEKNMKEGLMGGGFFLRVGG